MYPRIDIVAADGRPPELTPAHLPHPGDQLECYAELNRPAYLYVILFSSSAPARVLWPRAARLIDPAPDRFARCPADGADKMTIPAGNGVITVLVAGSEKPLDAKKLEELTAERFAWPSPQRAEYFPATAFPPPPPAENPGYLVVRGNGNAGLFVLPRDFKPRVEKLFDTYYAVMFPWQDGPGGAVVPGPKASPQR